MIRRNALLLIVCSFIALIAVWTAPDFNESTAATSAQGKLATETVVIKSVMGRRPDVVIQAEVARTLSEQRTGLMFRTEIGEEEGMLFIYDEPQVLTMWMKNTVIPLDMVFIHQDGHVIRVEENAEPETLAVRSSVEPAVAVLELKGGTARKRGIEPGDLVTYPR